MKILYFAWLRERLNKGSEDISPPAFVTTVSDLIDWLGKRDEAAEYALENRSVIKAAVDGKLVSSHSASIVGAATVALFPPMTGG